MTSNSNVIEMRETAENSEREQSRRTKQNKTEETERATTAGIEREGDALLCIHHNTPPQLCRVMATMGKEKESTAEEKSGAELESTERWECVC